MELYVVGGKRGYYHRERGWVPRSEATKLTLDGAREVYKANARDDSVGMETIPAAVVFRAGQMLLMRHGKGTCQANVHAVRGERLLGKKKVGGKWTQEIDLDPAAVLGPWTEAE